MIPEKSPENLLVLAQKIAKEFPEVQSVVAQMEKGTLGVDDTFRCITEILQTDPQIAPRYHEFILQTVVEQDISPRAPLNRPTGLSPLAEAALIERRQFDDDIPEFRAGGLARGVMPAVSVDTRVRNPVALGHMLKEASAQVAAKISAQEPARQAFLAKVAFGDSDALALIQKVGTALALDEARDSVLEGRSSIMDIPEYTRGQVPVPVRVAAPSGSALAAMTPQQKKENAWKFLSTTQGRRSAVRTVEELVALKLQGEGFTVISRPFEPGATESIVAIHEWSVGIDGPGAMQSSFSLIDVAGAAIAKGLTRQVGEGRRGRVILEVVAVNTVDVRTVGWAGRLLAADPELGMQP